MNHVDCLVRSGRPCRDRVDRRRTAAFLAAAALAAAARAVAALTVAFAVAALTGPPEAESPVSSLLVSEDAYTPPYTAVRSGSRAGYSDEGARRPSRRWTAESLPNPMTDPSACGMRTSSHLCDPDGYLSKGLLSKGRKQVLRALAAVDAGPTSPDCGPFQMGVALQHVPCDWTGCA